MYMKLSPYFRKKIFPIIFSFLLAILCGLLVTLARPPSALGFLTWIALIPLLFALRRSRPGLAFVYGFVAGLVYYSLSFQWTAAFHRYALPFVSLFSAIFFFGLPTLCIRAVLGTKKAAPFLAASIWVLFEFVKRSWFLQFPFGILGYSQYAWTWYTQIADLGGVQLISWLIVFVNASAFLALEHAFAGERGRLRSAAPHLAAIAAAFFIPLLYGSIMLAVLRYDPEPVAKVAFAQTLAPSQADWAKDEEKNLESLEGSVGEFRGLGVNLVLLPELAVNRALSYEVGAPEPGSARILNRVSRLAKETGVNLLFGSLESRSREGRVKNYNAVQMFSPDGNLADIYRKTLLVPFGETNPFASFLPSFSDYLVKTTGARMLDRGEAPHLFTFSGLNGRRLRFGVLICYESCFGDYARGYAGSGADFLVAATDDLWSGSSIEMYQHAIMSLFRAIETRTPVLQISNGGFSCYIDERGRYSSQIPIFRRGAMTSRLYLLRNKPISLYLRYGDWVEAASLLLILAFVIRAHIRKRPRRRNPAPQEP